MYVHVLLTLDRAYGKLFEYETYVELLFLAEYNTILDIAESFGVSLKDFRIDNLYVETYQAISREMNLEDEDYGDGEWKW